MSLFAVAALGGTGLGPVVAGWVEMNPRLEWRWIQWIQMMYKRLFPWPLLTNTKCICSACSIYLVLVPIVLTETRTAVLITRIAKKMRRETGNKRYRARVEDERASLKTLIYISCTRPIRKSTSYKPLNCTLYRKYHIRSHAH